MLKADFHIHTLRSMDCNTPIASIIDRCIKKGINCVNIADHDSIEGALELKKTAPFTVIVSEEILTPYGEIMGMFLEERIPSGISVEQAISRIREQNGLVCLPHPFDTFRGLKMGDGEIRELAKRVDLVEIFNARSRFRRCSVKARELAVEYGLPGTAGSDAHSAGEIGGTYVEMPGFSGRDDFLEALRQGRMHQQKAGLTVHLHSILARIRKAL